MSRIQDKTALGIALLMIAIGLILLSSTGCALRVGLQVKRPARCELQTVVMHWLDGDSLMEMNVCRYGARGRFPAEDHK